MSARLTKKDETLESAVRNLLSLFSHSLNRATAVKQLNVSNSNSKFLICLQPDGFNLSFLKPTLFDLTEYIV